MAGKRHVLTLDDAANLGLETHIKHAIGLVKDKILDVAEGDATTLYEVDQSAGGSNKKIAPALDLAELRAYIGTTVDNARADPRTVGELAGLIVDLRDQLTGGGQDEGSGVRLALAVTTAAATLGRNGGRTLNEGLVKDGEQETTSLAGTCLGASHQIATANDDGDRVLLDRGRDLVASKLDVAQEMLVQRGVGEGQDGLRDIMAGRSDRDVVVLLKVDASVLLARVISSAEELTLDARVGVANDVLAIAPATLTAADRTAAAAHVTADIGASTAVGVAVEATLTVAPRLLLRGRGRLVRSSAARSGTKVGVGTSIEAVVAGQIRLVFTVCNTGDGKRCLKLTQPRHCC